MKKKDKKDSVEEITIEIFLKKKKKGIWSKLLSKIESKLIFSLL